jgi:hypothetical protein
MNPIPVRVMVLDGWDEIALNVPPTATVADVKARALAQARVRHPAAGYVMKFRGAEVPEGATTMSDAGIVPNAGLIVLPRRRSAVR